MVIRRIVVVIVVSFDVDASDVSEEFLGSVSFNRMSVVFPGSVPCGSSVSLGSSVGLVYITGSHRPGSALLSSSHCSHVRGHNACTAGEYTSLWH